MDVVSFKDTPFIEFNSAVQGCLSAERKQDTLRLLLRYHLLDKEGGDRQEVYPVRDSFGGLDGCDVGVDQDRLYTILPQRLEGLCAGVIKFSCLADLECAGSEQENFLDCRSKSIRFA